VLGGPLPGLRPGDRSPARRDGHRIEHRRNARSNTSTALFKIRQFAELLAQQACAYVGILATPEDEFTRVLGLLRDRRVATNDVLDLFHGIRRAGNAAVPEGQGTRSDALHHLRMARQLAVWFHRSFGSQSGFNPGPFLPPPDPAQASAELHQELERLRQRAAEQQQQAEEVRLTARQILLNSEEEARLRLRAEQEAKAAYDELAAAVSLAEESAAHLEAEREQFRQQLAEIQARTAANAPEAVRAVVAQA
jgi:type I restriction enzyme R subunit